MGLKKGKILLVTGMENDLHPITSRLQKEGYEVLVTDIINISDFAKIYFPFAVIFHQETLEINLLHTCKIMRLQRKFNSCFFIFLSAFNDEDSIIKCIETGFDFYIPLPVSPLLLVSKINAINRRFLNGHNTLSRQGNILIDREKYLIEYNNTQIYLPIKEFELLALLMSKRGTVFFRDEILNRVWNNKATVRTIDVHVSRLRQKLGMDCIKTIKGMGYRLTL